MIIIGVRILAILSVLLLTGCSISTEQPNSPICETLHNRYPSYAFEVDAQQGNLYTMHDTTDNTQFTAKVVDKKEYDDFWFTLKQEELQDSYFSKLMLLGVPVDRVEIELVGLQSSEFNESFDVELVTKGSISFPHKVTIGIRSGDEYISDTTKKHVETTKAFFTQNHISADVTINVYKDHSQREYYLTETFSTERK